MKLGKRRRHAVIESGHDDRADPDGRRKPHLAERAGDGPPLVLLHGSVHDSRLWNGVFAELARHHTVVRYDARGLGRSSPPTAPFHYEGDLLEVLDRFGLQTAGLVGLSMGGEVALDFALEHPERVGSLTLIAASAGGHEWPPSPEMDAYISARRGSDGRRIAELELTMWASLGDRAPGFDVIEPMVRENADVSAAAEKGHALSPDQDAVGRPDGVTAPTLVVVGDHDHPEIGVIAARLAEAPRRLGCSRRACKLLQNQCGQTSHSFIDFLRPSCCHLANNLRGT